MNWRRVIVGCASVLVAGLVTAALLVGALWWYFHPQVDRTAGVVYGERHGKKLTLEVLRPRRPNGLGVVLVVSGGWKSSPASVHPAILAPVLRRGYSVFAVSHISQPEATVTEIAADLHRAVRFVRHHAGDYGIDPERLGVTGGSAGGHLSLLLATRGGAGDPAAADPVDRGSSAVQAVAIFFPVTDLLNLGSSTENPGDGGPPKSFVQAFGPEASDPVAWQRIGRDLSPIYHVTPSMPPVLILHGDADTLTPLEQAQWFQQRAREYGRLVKLVVRHGKKHGWPTMVWDVRRFADWFDEHLRTPALTIPPA
jgi:acetyl esterase/lipase